ncbi:MAG TPA: MBL fold metallo-hydrolase [Pirellulales bacterium]|jgi:UDP-MurNAc hydroxylase
MKFQVLSHAGLQVTSNGRTLVTDPWILGSCYWRSWWNYPPVPSELVRSLKPDFIYVTHIHWDHFQGPSLRKFDKGTRIYVPKGNFRRIRNDLEHMGFTNIVELRHGEAVDLAPDFRITSYQFGVFLDSALVIECEGIKILNANDAKFMGGPLKQIVDRHKNFDFVLRSHSSANSRLCYELIDAPQEAVDDISAYVENFADFALSSGATYAVPFASNQCYLHRETYRFNDLVQTPTMVRDYFEEHGIENPSVQVMVSGDSWSTEDGFCVSDGDYFTNREQRLQEYLERNREKLEKFYAKEARSKVTLADMQKYFDKFRKALPFFVKRSFRNKPITYVLTAGDVKTIFRVDLYRGTLEELDHYDDDANPIQIHTSTLIMRQCLKMDLFSHLAISKRVRYRSRKRDKRYIERLNSLFNFYEYDMLPMRRMLQGRFLQTWTLRWREVLLYFHLVFNKLVHGNMRLRNFLPHRPRPDAMSLTNQAIERARSRQVDRQPAGASRSV